MSTPQVSLVVPVFEKDVKAVQEAFLSLQQQSLHDFECLILDGHASGDVTTYLISLGLHDERFQYFDTRDLNLAASLNYGISRARAEFIARMDADDRCHIDRLKVQLNHLKNNINVGVLGTNIMYIDNRSIRTATSRLPLTNSVIYWCMNFINPIAHPTVMFRRVLWERHGRYCERLSYCEDLDLWLTWRAKGVTFENLPDVLLEHRASYAIRSFGNWLSNLRVRFRYLTWKNFHIVLFGMTCLVLWILFPGRLKILIYSMAKAKQN